MNEWNVFSPDSVLVVEDDAHTAELERRTLVRSGKHALVVGGARPALDALANGTFLAVLLDYRLPDGDPWAVLEAAQRCVPRVPVILVTGMGDERVAAEMIHRGGADYLIKTEGFWEKLPVALDRVIRLSQAEQSNSRLAAIVEASDDAILSTTLDGIILSWNGGAERLFGFTAAEVIGRHVTGTVLDESQFEALGPAIERVRRGESVAHIEGVRIRKDGTAVDVSTTLSPILDGAGGVAGVASISRDITARKQSELALRESAERNRILFDHSPLPMWLFDRDTREFLAVNGAAVHQYGYSRDELLAMRLNDIWPAEDAGPAFEERCRMPAELVDATVYRHRRKDGSILQVEVHLRDVMVGNRRSRLALLNDVTERRKIEEQLRQTQKMEAIGHLAGSVAHDFNNVLTVINGYADLALAKLEPGHGARSDVTEILKAGERAATLTGQLLSFSRKREVAPDAVDVNAVVTDMNALLRRLLGDDVALVTSLTRPLGQIRAALGQMDQVIMNLAVNARDAMGGRGTLSIETSSVDLDDSFVRGHLGVRAGPHILLAVTDTGCGMDRETLSRVFEPFFTTKGEKGNGLGLATVFGIVKQCGGHVYVYSEPGRGTTFKIYLPIVDDPLPQTAPALTEAATKGHETILLVDDDDQIRRLARRILEAAGYRVLEADGPAKAIELGRDANVDLLVTDVVMPAMSGLELARTLEKTQPAMKVLFASGYTSLTATRDEELPSKAHFLGKPYAPKGLVRKVQEVLSGG